MACAPIMVAVCGQFHELEISLVKLPFTRIGADAPLVSSCMWLGVVMR